LSLLCRNTCALFSACIIRLQSFVSKIELLQQDIVPGLREKFEKFFSHSAGQCHGYSGSQISEVLRNPVS
jgi:hypothetical protein